MEKVINIDGRDVTFKSNGADLLRYKTQFKRDYLADLMGLVKLQDDIEKGDYSNIDFVVFFNICWVLAKNADKTIPAPLEWFETFDTFPFADIIEELMDLLVASISSKKK